VFFKTFFSSGESNWNDPPLYLKFVFSVFLAVETCIWDRKSLGSRVEFSVWNALNQLYEDRESYKTCLYRVSCLGYTIDI